MNDFQYVWKAINSDKLSAQEISEIRSAIKDFKDSKITFKQLMTKIKSYKKLDEPYKIQRVLRTELSRNDTLETKQDAKEEGIKKFKIRPSPGACEKCLKISEHGRKIFTEKELKKDGKELVPFHPQCNCTLIEYYD